MPTATHALGTALGALLRADDALPADERAFVDELAGRLRERREDVPAPEAAEALAAFLVAAAGPQERRQALLTDAVGRVARLLAPADEPPATAGEAEAWLALVAAVDALSGSGVRALGRLPFVSDRLLQLLLAEAAEQLAGPAGSRSRMTGQPGRVLASVAASGKLREALGAALGFEVAPTYDAVYLAEPPGSHVRTHVDSRDYPVVFHLILAHTLPGDGGAGSALVAHLPGEPRPARLRLAPGDAVALRGRGTIHSWEPLAGDEERTLLAVGFRPAVPEA